MWIVDDACEEAQHDEQRVPHILIAVWSFNAIEFDDQTTIFGDIMQHRLRTMLVRDILWASFPVVINETTRFVH